MRILLTGIDGQLGFELERALAPLGEVIGSTLSGRSTGGAACEPMDLSDSGSIGACLQRLRPDLVVNPAAYTAVDRAESEPALAHAINAEGVATLAQWCARHDVPLLHYSTDYVFSGEQQRPWREDDAPAPLGVYGASKLAGEQAIRASGCPHLILRTAWVYSARFNNFLKTMLRLGSEREELRVVADQRGAPTTARGLAELSAALIARGAHRDADGQGTFHAVHAGECSWQEFACAIFERAQRAGLLARVPNVQAIASQEYPTPARRPAYSVLDGSRLRERYGLALPAWQIGLDQVIDELATR